MRTKKYIKQYLLIALVGFFAASCIENIPEVETLPTAPVAFGYKVVDEEYQLEFYIYSNIGFYSNSALTGEHTWDFGDGTPPVTAGRNDTVVRYFSTAGLYMVTLTVEDRSIRQPIMIQDIVPIMSVKALPEGEVHEVLNTPVNILVELPNPRNMPVRYNWIFPSRTFDGEMNQMTNYEGENQDGLVGDPGDLIFGNVGSQQVRLQVWLGDRLLQEGRVNVQIGLDQPAPTLYFAVRGRNIMALKLPTTPHPDPNVQILPFDMGVSAGRTPMNILFHTSARDEGLLYILDAGAHFWFRDDMEFQNQGDGEIRVMSRDGAVVERMLRNAGHCFNDPFHGLIEGTDIFYSNRNTGIARRPISTRNEVHTAGRDDFPFWHVQNSTLNYMNRGIPWGSLNTGFTKVGEVWWWGKRHTAPGIFRFRDSDILPVPVGTGSLPLPADGIAMRGINMSSFMYDARNDFFYFAIYHTGMEGLYRLRMADIDALPESPTSAQLAPFRVTTAEGRNVIPIVASGRGEGTADEPLAITQLALDQATGNVYFGLRSENPDDVPTGLHRFNPVTNNIEFIPITAGMNILGVAVNNTPSKLF